MSVKVLVVDDSMFFRRRITKILNADPNIEVMDTANDGAEAVEKACRLEPDVITMDVEIPVMNGVEAVKKIMQLKPTPILIVQHMPAEFTFAFAKRLNDICKITIKEASDGCVLQPATAYLAPGGKQMVIKNRSPEPIIMIESGDNSLTYKPSVDVTFSSLANDYHGKVLAVILTGMGTDGYRGVKQLKEKGAIIWAQDEDSCVVYGMPSAIVQAGLTEKVLPLKEIGINLAKVI